MPRYSFTDTNTGEEFNQIMTIAERDTYLEENPHIKQKLATPAFGDSVRLGIRRPDDNFNDVLKKAKSAHRHSTIQTR